MLHGVIDSPDIPLNVSRSYLQEDANVKKISGYISKVADKLASMFKKDRAGFGTWEDLKVFVSDGILTDEKLLKGLRSSTYTRILMKLYDSRRINICKRNPN